MRSLLRKCLARCIHLRPSAFICGYLSLMRWLLIHLVLLYRVTLGPYLGGNCRYQPSCSQYAIDALNKYGAMRGGWKALKRIFRCHPFGGGGFDPA